MIKNKKEQKLFDKENSEKIKKIYEKIRNADCISCRDLWDVLYIDPEHLYSDETVKDLWQQFDCGRRYLLDQGETILSDQQKTKRDYWIDLLNKWTADDPEHWRLNLYVFEGGELLKWSKKYPHDRSGRYLYIKLSELKECFNKLNLSLPEGIITSGLSNKKNKANPEKNEDIIEKLVSEALPEIEVLYESVLKTGLNSDWRKIKQAVLSKFENGKFSYLKKEYLEDDNIYKFGVNHQRRKFFGSLLDNVVESKSLKSPGATKLYTLSNKLKQKQFK